MDIEIEWGFDPATAEKDYSGRIETYDGAWPDCARLDGERGTAATGLAFVAFHRQRPATAAGVKLSLLYMGTSKWRRVQPFTTQRDDVARTIVTLVDQGGQLLLPGGGPGERTDPRARVRVLCAADATGPTGVSATDRRWPRRPPAPGNSSRNSRPGN